MVSIKTTGHDKSCFTVELVCMADGTKLKAMIIFKRKTMPKGKLPSGVVLHIHPKDWMDEEGCVKWIKEVWEKRPGRMEKVKSFSLGYVLYFVVIWFLKFLNKYVARIQTLQ